MAESKKQDMRITDAELSILKNTFGDNLPLLKLMRKVFLPEISPDAPLQQNIDLWLLEDIESKPAEEALINLKARGRVIKHIEACLIMLNTLAGQKSESLEDTKKRLERDSSK